MTKRIHICGIYGSGKSTLAGHLSKNLNIPFHSLDDIKYKIKYSKMRPVSERIFAVQRICKKKEWITEGTWSNYAEDAFKNSDFIILLLPLKYICYYRILKRHLFRKKDKSDTLIGALRLMVNVHKYHATHDPVSLSAHLTLIKKYQKKHIIIKNKKQLKSLIKKLVP